MSDTKDELLFRQVLEEMGIPIQEGQGGITINGIPAVQYLEEHDIFAVPEEVQIKFRNFGGKKYMCPYRWDKSAVNRGRF